MRIKTELVQVRITPELRKQVEEVVAKTGIPQSILVEACIKAFVDYVREHDEITLPLTVKPLSAEEKKKIA